ncbi:MAG: hypothetical protein IT376_00740 [Polyangiaceae bacterium]|nr:hypothetical protein [Polyangiaceae bacterium]
MADFSAALAPITTSATLWLAPALPLAAALWAAWSAGAEETARAPSDRARARGVALAALAALVVVLAAAADVLGGSAPATVVSSAGPMARIGSFELAFTLSLDSATAPIVLALALAGAVLAAAAALDDAAPPRALTASGGVALAGALLAALADAAPVHAAGLTLAGVGAAALTRRAAAVSAAVVAALATLGGSLVVAWALAGSFVTGELVLEPRARLVAVEVEGPATPGAKEGDLTLAALPGASVNLGGATLCETSYEGARGGIGAASRPCRVPARAPFSRLPVPPAMQELRIDAGPGLDQLLVSRARVTPGRETRLVATGATFAPREIETAIALRAENGSRPLRDALAGRRLGELPAVGVGVSLLALAWLLLAAGGAAARAVPWLALAGAAGAVRWAGVAALAPWVGAWVALAATGVAVGQALLALRARSLAMAASSLAASAAAIALAAVAVGAPAAAAGILAAATLAAAALSLDPGAARDWIADPRAPRAARRRAVGTAALALLAGAPLPLGVALGREDAVARGLVEPSLASLAAVALGLAATLGAAAAAWRARGLAWDPSPSPPESETPLYRIYASAVLAAAALAAGLTVTGTGLLDGAAPWLHARLPPETAALLPPPAPARAVAGLATLAVAAVGAGLAARAYGARRPADWRERERALPGVGWLDATLAARRAAPEAAPAPLAALRDLAEAWTTRVGGPPPEDTPPGAGSVEP